MFAPRFIVLALAFLYTGLYGTLVLAQDTRSEFFYQAHPGEHFIDGVLNYNQYKHTPKDSAFPGLDYKMTILKVAYEYGVMETLSVYGNLSYGDEELDDLVSHEGIGELNLGAKYKYNFQSSAFFSRINVGLGIWGKYDCSASGGTATCSRTDQSINLSLLLGYMFQFSDANLGFAVESGVFSTKGVPAMSSDKFKKEVSSLATLFYEKTLGDSVWGGALQYILSTFGGHEGSSVLSGMFYMESIPEIQFAQLKTYARFPLSPSLQALGEIFYSRVVDSEDSGQDGGNGFGAKAGLRYTF